MKQWYLQWIQFISFLLFKVVDWSGQSDDYPRKIEGVIGYTALLNVLIFAPVAGLVHWLLNFEAAFRDKDNQMKSWLIIYPCMSIMTVAIFIAWTQRINK